MPIRPDQRWFYPLDWPQLSRFICFEPAQGRCERCRRPHRHRVTQTPDGNWWDEHASFWRDDRGRRVRALPCPERLAAAMPSLAGFDPPGLPCTLVVPATAHLDHDPSNNRARNLAALCRRCHLAHHRAAHRRQRWATLFYRRALGDLFTGVYR